MKNPFEHYSEIALQENKEGTELVKYIFEKEDKATFWIVGFSIGGISIIANNMFSFADRFPNPNINLVLIFLIISVVSGIIQRNLSLHFLIVLSQIQQFYKIAFSGDSTIDVVSRLNGNENFEQLIEKIKIGTGRDYSDFLKVNKEERPTLTKHLLEQYNMDLDFANKDVERFNQYFAEIDNIALGVKKEKTLESIKNPKIGKNYKLVKYSYIMFYYIHLITFVLALIIFGFFSI